MADTPDEGRLRRVKVNQRELMIDVTSGQITAGPPALHMKWLCMEQVADLIVGGSVIEHLYASDTEDGVRLARVDYITARAAERRGGFAVGSHVRFGRHGIFRISGYDVDKDEYQLMQGSQRINVPCQRLTREAVVIDPNTPRREVHGARNLRPEMIEQDLRVGPQAEEHEGDLQIDDVELATLIGDSVREWIRDNRDEVIKLLGESLGQERE